MGKSKRDYHDLGAEENTEKEVERISKKKKLSVDSEVDEINFNSTKDAEKKSKEKKNKEDLKGDKNDLKCMKDAKKEKKKKKKKRRMVLDSEVEENDLKSMKDAKKKRKKKKQREDSEAEESYLKSTEDVNKKRKKKKQSEHSEAEENYLNSTEDSKERQSEHSEAKENSLNSTEDAKKKRKEKRQSEDLETGETNLNSTEDAKKKRKKKRQSGDSEAAENNLNSTGDAKKKRQSEDSEAAENILNSIEDAKKKRKKKRQSEDSEAAENNLNSIEDAKKNRKKKKKKKRQSEDSEAGETNMSSTKDAHMEREKKQKCVTNDKYVTTPLSKSTTKVTFSDQVEVFPAEDEGSKEEEGKLVRGKRFTKEENELLKNAVQQYVDDHALGDEGVKMVMKCRLHPQLKGCWKEIVSVLPWRPYESVYNRAHTIFEAGSKGKWTKEELVLEYQKQHGNDWRTLADAMGRSRKHVRFIWRRMRLTSRNKGSWTREEYQNLFDLVNKEIKMKVFQQKHSKHGMLRDNIPWVALCDQLETRDNTDCCIKWYKQLTSPLVAKGIWANVDDYKLLDELLKLDAACIDDVDWDNLLDNRNGETCRKRWDQMVKHIGSPISKTFVEQVEILGERYNPDLAEDRENFDNRPYDR